MILTIKAKECKQLPDGTWQLTTNCESLRESLQAHSPNILVDYLNENYGLIIEPIKSWKFKGGKEVDHGTNS